MKRAPLSKKYVNSLWLEPGGTLSSSKLWSWLANSEVSGCDAAAFGGTTGFVLVASARTQPVCSRSNQIGCIALVSDICTACCCLYC
jgi:hypothetical protein